MTIAGIILAVVGGAGVALELTGNMSVIPALDNLNVPLIGWAAVLGAGLVLMMLNRRPGN